MTPVFPGGSGAGACQTPPASLARLSVVCETFAAVQLDRRFKTLDFYKSIKLT